MLADPVLWSDVENGAYSADLPLWEELAGKESPILELGCGSGRVALHLARRGSEVVTVDRVPELVAAVQERADAEALHIEAVIADVTALDLGRRFENVLAPMQIAHMIADPADRAAMLMGVRDHLVPSGMAAFALLDERAATAAYEAGREELVPDIREHEGWVCSSRPLAIRSTDEGIEIQGLRQVVAPDGEMAEAEHSIRLAHVDPAEFEHEAREAGLVSAGRRQIEPTAVHMGSTVVLLTRRN